MEHAKYKQKYLDYLSSVEWLIKKSKLVMYFVSRNIPIHCIFCEATKSLQVHHLTYDTLFNEDLEDLAFVCSKCHTKHHIELKNGTA